MKTRISPSPKKEIPAPQVAPSSGPEQDSSRYLSAQG